jgi:hypothetical protein
VAVIGALPRNSRPLTSGSYKIYRFDMMSKRLYKTYVNLTNIVVRISDGTPEGKEHAVLVNSHLDSTLPSPGAADDALSVGVMLECMRVLVNTPDWSPKHAIVFREFRHYVYVLEPHPRPSVQPCRGIPARWISLVLNPASSGAHVCRLTNFRIRTNCSSLEYERLSTWKVRSVLSTALTSMLTRLQLPAPRDGRSYSKQPRKK